MKAIQFIGRWSIILVMIVIFLTVYAVSLVLWLSNEVVSLTFRACSAFLEGFLKKAEYYINLKERE